MVLRVFGEGKQPRDTARPNEPRKIRPLAVRSGDMLALKLARMAAVPAAAAPSETEISARGESNLTR